MDGPWSSTIERWQREGMPANVDYVDYFDLDRVVYIRADNSPRYPERVVEETAEYVITTTEWGATLRNWRHAGGVPEFMDFTIVDPQTWAEAKARMQPSRDRINWERVRRQYQEGRARGAWITAGMWFGFDATHSWIVGTERVLVAMVEQPEWMRDLFNHCLDVDLALLDMIWDAGYHFDQITWGDDMGYKNAQFFSLGMYRDLVKPAHKRAADWAHAHGVKVHLHACGNMNPFVPDLIELGIDMLNPLEVKAGMNPVALKQKFGNELAFHGGLNAVLYERPAELWEEMRRVIPVMKENGGYVISSDHSVPESVSLEEFREFVRLAKELGS
jgi:uroporphyrinogen decarboxylase